MAVDIQQAIFGEAVGLTSGNDVTRLYAAAVAVVDRFAPDAPPAVANEAAVRVGGWLHQQPAPSIRSEAVGEVRTSYDPTMTSALRASGAMALLSPWKVRRAGAV